MKKLSKLQKRALVILSRIAWDRMNMADEGLDQDDWRTEQAIIACGRRISSAFNDDFNSIKAHFLNLAGNSGAAFAATLRSGNEDQRRARHNLEAACLKAGFDLRYADGICRDQFRCPLDAATAEQMKKLLFTVVNRARSKAQTRHGIFAANSVTNSWEASAEK